MMTTLAFAEAGLATAAFAVLARHHARTLTTLRRERLATKTFKNLLDRKERRAAGVKLRNAKGQFAS